MDLKEKYIGIVERNKKRSETNIEEIDKLLKKINMKLNTDLGKSNYKFDLVEKENFQSPTEKIKTSESRLNNITKMWMEFNDQLEKIKDNYI